MRIEAPKSWGEVAALGGLIALGGGYMLHQNERIAAAEKQLSTAPLSRNRTEDALRDELKELRDKLMCPCGARK